MGPGALFSALSSAPRRFRRKRGSFSASAPPSPPPPNSPYTPGPFSLLEDPPPCWIFSKTPTGPPGERVGGEGPGVGRGGGRRGPIYRENEPRFRRKRLSPRFRSTFSGTFPGPHFGTSLDGRQDCNSSSLLTRRERRRGRAHWGMQLFCLQLEASCLQLEASCLQLTISWWTFRARKKIFSPPPKNPQFAADTLPAPPPPGNPPPFVEFPIKNRPHPLLAPRTPPSPSLSRKK